MRKIHYGFYVLLALGCAHAPRFDASRRPTCLVLSAGGPDGVVHLGAVAAIREAGLPISCVAGSSMGALVGAVYASAPGEDTRARFEALLRSYASETRTEAARKGVALALLFGAAAAVATGGVVAPALAAGSGLALGAEATPRMDLDRLVRVMDRFFAGQRIEALPLPYVSFHQRPEGAGLALVAARTGGLAEAVGHSVANPFLFPDLDVRRAAALDPGADRAAATPVEDACRLFPDANLLAINVTGRPAFHGADMRCPLLEVRVEPPGLHPEQVADLGPDYARAVALGRALTAAALAKR